MSLNAFNLDKFTFLRIEHTGSEVVAFFAETSFLDRTSYSQDEVQTYGLLQGAIDTLKDGSKRRKVLRNIEQLRTGFEAIRAFKVEHGIPLDVQNPKTVSD